MIGQNVNWAPYPAELDALVAAVRYKPRWTFTLENTDRGQSTAGLTLIITITTQDSYEQAVLRTVAHYFPVPPAAYDMRSWRRWLLEQVLLVERHEACEFFTLEQPDGQLIKPYAPSHGPGNDPYMIRELGTDLDQRTTYKGELA